MKHRFDIHEHIEAYPYMFGIKDLARELFQYMKGLGMTELEEAVFLHYLALPMTDRQRELACDPLNLGEIKSARFSVMSRVPRYWPPNEDES